MGRAGFLPLRPMHLTTMSFPSLSSDRPAHLVRRSQPETYELTLILGGAMYVAQERCEICLSAGDLAMWTSSRPYTGQAISGPGTGAPRAVILHLPQALVPLPQDRKRSHMTAGLRVSAENRLAERDDHCYFPVAVRENEEVVPVNAVLTWVLSSGVTVGR